MTNDFLQQLFAHDEWANARALLSIERADGVPKAVRLIAHIAAAEWVWLWRLKQEPQRLAVWPELSLRECREHLSQLPAAWREYLESGHSPDSTVRYTNSKGEHFENRINDILMHVAMHSQYHRGQIAMVLRDAGANPAYTDYIEWVRRP